MHSAKKISAKKINHLLPAIQQRISTEICSHCNYVNKTDYSFCTNCGYPLHDAVLADNYFKLLKEKKQLLYQAESAVVAARIILYVMGAFLLLGIFFVFSGNSVKYLIAMLALVMSCLFFFLAFWSRNNPLPAMLTAFIILITFSAINIFGKLKQSFTTMEGLIGILICTAILFIILKGVQGAHRIALMKQELQIKM
jgi:VIT1/CCC1 family predicted Fe2+/Mn2+ transporter